MRTYAVLFNSYDSNYSVIYKDGYDYPEIWYTHAEDLREDDAKLLAGALNERNKDV